MSVQQNPQVGGNKKVNTAKQKQLNSWIWIMLMANFVFILLLITVGVMALKVGNVLPDGVDILYIVGKNPDFSTGDDKQTWEQSTRIDIFKAEYTNGEGETTVVSQDGTKVIAPGTISTYRFGAYNNGNMAVIYQLNTGFDLMIGGDEQSEYTFPLAIRIKTTDGRYIIGGQNLWIPVEMATSGYLGVLGANSYEEFVLELNWSFEGGNDELDTLYGNMSAEKGVSLTFEIESHAEEHLDPSAQGGKKINAEADNGKLNEEYGGEIRWFWLILLIVNTGILIFYVSFLMTRRLEKRK